MVQTINDLYFVLSVQEVSLSLAGWLKGAGVSGTGTSGPVAGRGYVELVGYGG